MQSYHWCHPQAIEATFAVSIEINKCETVMQGVKFNISVSLVTTQINLNKFLIVLP